MPIGENIKIYRTNRGLTQKQLAEKCLLSESAIKYYESNRRNPKIETLNKIAETLEIPVSTLLWDESKFIKDLLSYFQQAYHNSTNHFPEKHEIINILIDNSIITTLLADLIMADYNNLSIKEIENLISFIKKLDQNVYQNFIDNEETKKSRLLGEKISAIRNKNNMPITDLSILTGIKEFLLMKIEKGFMTYPPEDFLKKIASALNISVKDLINETSINIQVNKDFYTNLEANELGNLMGKWNLNKEYLKSMSKEEKEKFIDDLSKISPIEFKVQNCMDNFENFTKNDLVNLSNEILDYGFSLVEKFVDTEYESLRKEYVKTASLLEKTAELNKINENIIEGKDKQIEILKSECEKYKNATDKFIKQLKD